MLPDESLFHFFKKAHKAFLSSVGEEPSDFFLSLNGQTIRLSFADDLFRNILTPALAHLQTEPHLRPHFTICIWDTAASGVLMPPPPWSRDQYGSRSSIQGWGDQRFSLSFQLGSSTLSLFDREEKLALYWTHDFHKLPYWERGAPLLALFQWWAEEEGGTLIHAGSVGSKNKGALLVGKGGSGKSTTALSCLNSPLFYASDDYTLFFPQPTPRILSLYSSAKITEKTVEKLPHLGSLKPTNEEKLLVYLFPQWKEKLINSMPLKALFVPKITGSQKAEVIPCSSSQALLALAPSTLFQLSGTGSKAFQTMSQLTRSTACYELRLGTDFQGNVDAIEEIVG